MRLMVLVALSVLLILNAFPSSAEITNKLVVKLKPEASLEEVAATHPFVKFERASTLPRVFVFSVQNIEDVGQEADKFTSDYRVAWAHIDETTEYQPMDFPRDPSLQSGAQWFHDHINSSYAWSKGLSGQGQLVQVIDTPVFPEEKDLVHQLDFARSFEGNVTEPPPLSIAHGTVCTNIIVAEANDFCGVGVAFSARAAAFPFIAHRERQFTFVDFAEALGQGFSVSSNSYGPSLCRFWGCNIHPGLPPVLHDALELSQNRNSSVFVFASGNEGANQGSPNFGDWASSPRVMMVGATRIDGTRARYSNVGPANWIVAPAGDHGENVTWTSSIVNNEQQCGDVGVGTSYAAPMVSGAAAILRSAYPSLTWRDVKLILAYSADKTDPEHESWIKNGAGRWFSNHYGFGQLNVGKAVELGASWKSLEPLHISTFRSTFNKPIPIPANNTAITPLLPFPYGIVSRVESVQLTLNMAVVRRGDFQVELVSPLGTNCLVFPIRRDTNSNYNDFVTSVNCFLGEDPVGQWMLRVTRSEFAGSFPWLPADVLNSFAVTVWGEAVPSQVELLAPSTATRLSQFTITEGNVFKKLELFNNYPATIGLFWKDAFGLYGELFTTAGKQTTGTQRLNPSNSDHPTISVFYGGDHVLTYLENVNGSVAMKAEVRNIDFIPLTPLTVLPFNDVEDEFLSVAAVEDHIIVSYRSLETKLIKLVLLNVNFGSRDTTPLCVPFANFTTEADGDVSDSDNNCTETIYRRDGEISLLKQIEIRTQFQVVLQSIGMNLVLGTWNDGQSITAALIRADLTMNVVTLQAPVADLISAAATPEDVFIAFGSFGNSQLVLVERYDMDMVLHESFAIPTNERVIAVNLAYSHVEGLSLVIATSHNISVTTFLRDRKSTNRAFVQTNQATIASMMSQNVPVLDVDQSVMPNGDLVVTFSTIQEIHVQLFAGSIFGSVTKPTVPPTAISSPLAVTSPQYNIVPQGAVESPENPDNQLPSWAIALIVIGSLLIIFFAVIFIVAYQKKRRSQSRVIVQQDPDLIAYTKMNV